MRLPWTFSTFDYPELCAAAVRAVRRRVRDRRVKGRRADRGTSRSDGPGRPATRRWSSTAWAGGGSSGSSGYQPPDAPLSRGLEVHPGGAADDLEIWIDRDYVPAGYGWSFPARDEVRVGVGSFDPRFAVKEPTVRLARDLDRDAVRYQGNWIPHQLRDAAEGGIFFVGDSAGHCLPLTAEGIRTAFYFGIACGRELPARRRRAWHARRGAARLRRVLGRAPVEVRVAASGPAAGPARAAPPARAGPARDGPATASCAGRSATTCGSRRPSSPGSRDRARPAAPSRSPPDPTALDARAGRRAVRRGASMVKPASKRIGAATSTIPARACSLTGPVAGRRSTGLS